MMKVLGITQRVEVVQAYSERRDCLDQRWWNVAHSLGFVPAPLPNVPTDRMGALLNGLNISAILLSGGNSLAFLDSMASDAAPERDHFELGLIEWATHSKIPILGICRGMQIINRYFGGDINKVTDHVGNRHMVTFCDDFSEAPNREVNSYHNWGIPSSGLGEGLVSLAMSADDTVEGFRHTSERVAGVMWHPEREPQVHPHDLQLLQGFLL